MSNRLFVAGITSNEFPNINQMIEPIKEVIDGLVFVVDNKGLTDGTWDYLNENRKAGKIIHYPWVNDFSMSFNQMLLQGNMEHNQTWFIQLDSRERVNPNFIKLCKDSLLNELEQNSVVGCYQRSKPCLIKYTNFLRYFGNPHCGVAYFNGNLIDLAQDENFKDDKKYVWSTRIGDESWVKNGVKYMLMPHSNQTTLVWGETHRFPTLSKEEVDKQFKNHEQARQWLLHYWFSLFNKWPTGEDITEYMKKPVGEWDLKLKDYFCFEVIFVNHYRWQVLGEKIEDIMTNQWNFDLKKRLNDIPTT